jgi:hypothetical protein
MNRTLLTHKLPPWICRRVSPRGGRQASQALWAKKASSSTKGGMSDKAHGPVSFPLRDGGALPSVGLGTYQVKGEAGYHAVLEALKVRYCSSIRISWLI